VPSFTARQFASCRPEKSGPNPTGRRTPGSKHHFIVEGILLAVILNGANPTTQPDIAQIHALILAIPPIRARRRGAPRAGSKSFAAAGV
jgi:hypothetical protein